MSVFSITVLIPTVCILFLILFLYTQTGEYGKIHSAYTFNDTILDLFIILTWIRSRFYGFWQLILFFFIFLLSSINFLICLVSFLLANKLNAEKNVVAAIMLSNDGSLSAFYVTSHEFYTCVYYFRFEWATLQKFVSSIFVCFSHNFDIFFFYLDMFFFSFNNWNLRR